MAGPILILLFLFVVGPIGLFVVGGMWSAVQGWTQSEDADRRATAPTAPTDEPA